MKVVFVLPVNGITGGNFVVYRHAHFLQSRGHEVQVVFASSAHGLDVPHFPNFGVPVRSLAEVYASEESYDLVVATWWATFYDMFFIPARAYAYFCQSDDRAFYASRWNPKLLLATMTYRHARVGMITMARWLKDLLRKEFGQEAYYAPNGIDLQTFHPRVSPLEPRGSKVRVLIEGPGAVASKGVDNAFKVAAQVQGIDVWHVATDGVCKPEWQADRTFKAQPLQNMPAIYASCDILLKLSQIESFSLPPLEMMACGGTAVIAKTNGAEEYARDSENCLLVEPNDEQAAVRALSRLVSDAPLRRSLSEGGIKTAQTMSWESRGHLFEQALVGILAKLGSVAHRPGIFPTLLGAPMRYKLPLLLARAKRALKDF